MAASSGQLSSEADNLTKVISFFKIDDRSKEAIVTSNGADKRATRKTVTEVKKHRHVGAATHAPKGAHLVLGKNDGKKDINQDVLAEEFDR